MFQSSLILYQEDFKRHFMKERSQWFKSSYYASKTAHELLLF